MKLLFSFRCKLWSGMPGCIVCHVSNKGANWLVHTM